MALDWYSMLVRADEGERSAARRARATPEGAAGKRGGGVSFGRRCVVAARSAEELAISSVALHAEVFLFCWAFFFGRHRGPWRRCRPFLGSALARAAGRGTGSGCGAGGGRPRLAAAVALPAARGAPGFDSGDGLRAGVPGAQPSV